METGDEEADDEDRTDGEDGGGHSSNCLLRSLHRITPLSLKTLNFNGRGKKYKTINLLDGRLLIYQAPCTDFSPM